MADTSSLSGKYAIITGSTQGLGEAIARLFAERGAAGMIICGRNAERGQAVAADLNSDQCNVRFVQTDLASVEDCRAIVAAQPFGRLLKPDEVARAVAFLASDESGMMTGSIVDFDQSVMGGGPQPIPPVDMP
jgi:NAD(P)-dependent dehydrogenase (short-subunit alcohol dehydrogenase family)